MFKLLIRIIPAILFWGTFVFVIFQVPYPETITQASTQQLLSFFVPLILAITLTINIILKNIYLSASFSLGLIFLLILKSLDSLNIVTAILTIIAVALLISYFSKVKARSHLTKLPKIPKLTSLSRKKMHIP